MLPARLRVLAGDVGRIRDVDRERDLGLERERRRPRAVVADLLLHGRDRDDVDLASPASATPPRRLERDVRAEPVVERLRDDAAVRQLERLALPDPGVARADARGRVVAVARADVHVEVLAAQARTLPRSLRAGRDDRRRRPGPPSRPAITTRWPARIVRVDSRRAC